MALTAWLFSYGSLQQPAVQVATFGRKLAGRRDVLAGFVLGTVRHGERAFANASRVAGPGCLEGTVFEVSAAELAAADAYEHADAYTRIPVVLASGTEAWMYVDAASLQRPEGE